MAAVHFVQCVQMNFTVNSILLKSIWRLGSSLLMIDVTNGEKQVTQTGFAHVHSWILLVVTCEFHRFISSLTWFYFTDFVLHALSLLLELNCDTALIMMNYEFNLILDKQKGIYQASSIYLLLIILGNIHCKYVLLPLCSFSWWRYDYVVATRSTWRSAKHQGHSD